MSLPVSGLAAALLLLVLASVTLANEAPAEIQTAIDETLKRGGKITDADRFAPVTKFGAAAVPGVIERFAQETGRRRVALIELLCYLGTPEARTFLKKVAGEREDRDVVYALFQRFPEDHFDEILPEAIQSEGYHFNCFFAGERAVNAVRRNPKLAGVIVAALQDQPPTKSYTFWVGSLLEEVTGWAMWQSDGMKTNEADHDLGDVQFWRKWWSRNQDKAVLDWRVEAYRAHPNSAQQKEHALQGVSLLHDRRAVSLCLEALDDPDASVRYWSVYELKRLDGFEGGYLFETFKTEDAQVISRLKARWAGN